jgi:hypothetical protein
MQWTDIITWIILASTLPFSASACMINVIHAFRTVKCVFYLKRKCTRVSRSLFYLRFLVIQIAFACFYFFFLPHHNVFFYWFTVFHPNFFYLFGYDGTKPMLLIPTYWSQDINSCWFLLLFIQINAHRASIWEDVQINKIECSWAILCFHIDE